ncbi:hypothetical protein NPIL_645491 [Nephila pilipes]|uniref:Uncharacterized protein n=1 Tax=Nephila pilipes TaxID=299642 RepID=A0A8X6TTA6_NEPPI|nr:hypothetical protein NPIL_645491 [Nephila pilipes]
MSYDANQTCKLHVHRKIPQSLPALKYATQQNVTTVRIGILFHAIMFRNCTMTAYSVGTILDKMSNFTVLPSLVFALNSHKSSISTLYCRYFEF